MKTTIVSESLPWKYDTRLSGSENHKGFIIISSKNFRIAEVYPIDFDGIEGKTNVELIVQAVNEYDFLKRSHTELLDVIKNMVKLLQVKRMDSFSVAMWIENLQAIIRNAEKVQK